ncbi:hypothetical protein XENOCAPTIV_028720 [Xenoophorus captivus]|uniref:Uncharacterized protein n=1 Tax=Xenoophorus captivus TaxID=1517983 RepID=A0ABV0REA1_9TELE
MAAFNESLATEMLSILYVSNNTFFYLGGYGLGRKTIPCLPHISFPTSIPQPFTAGPFFLSPAANPISQQIVATCFEAPAIFIPSEFSSLKNSLAIRKPRAMTQLANMQME